MICRLCLTESHASLAIFSEEKIRKYITKFLQLELILDDPVSKVVCTLCWNQLDNFNIFCLRVEEAQKSLVRVHDELKSDQKISHSNVSLAKDLLSENVNLESNLNSLKEETIVEGSDDDAYDNSDTFQCLEENISDADKQFVKVEPQNGEKSTDTTSPETNENLPTRRVTRATKHQTSPGANENPPTRRDTRATKHQPASTLDKVTASNIEMTRKCRKAESEKVEDHPEPPRDQTAGENIPDVNLKRKRGRPRKGEEKPKIEKVRSAKSHRILETAKEFDEIIQKNMDLVCNMCAAQLIDFAELKRHFRVVHNRKGYAVCCNKRLYKRGLVVDHIKTHNNPEYFKCTDCGKVLADRMCLRNHVLLMHQNEEDKTFQCPYCPKKYAKQYLLDHHQVKHIPQTECAFTCSDCGRGFPTKTTLTKHLNQIHSTIYDKMCEICAKLIRGKAAFERHMEEHEGVVRPQVQCVTCGSWLKDKNSLRKHMYKHDGKSYSCNVCGKSTPSKSALQSHHRYVHQTVRQFQCTFCDKAFKKAVNLREHLTTHTGEVLYTCPHCPKTFNSKANMHAHRKKKHREEWEANRRYNVKIATSTDTKSAES